MYKIFFRFALLFNEIQNQFAKAIAPFPQPSKKSCHFMTNRFPERWKTFTVKIAIFILLKNQVFQINTSGKHYFKSPNFI